MIPNPYKVAPLVFVYPKAYKDHESLLEYLKDGPKGHRYSVFDWEPWEPRGQQASINVGLKSKLEEDDTGFDASKSFIATYDEVLADYIDRNNIKLSNPENSNIAFNYYDEGALMDFHTDYDPTDPDQPFYSITINCYLNDDYEGGDLIFKLSDSSELDLIRYTPQAGDLVVIPSSPPYMHMSDVVTRGRKYFSHRVVTEDRAPSWQSR